MNDEQARYSHIPDSPILKIFLCGPLRILRRKNTNVDLPPIYQDVPSSEWGERPGPTLNLLKLLLCSENRHATKTFLADTLWPESGEKEGRHSLSQATRVLRVLLRTNEEEPKNESKMKSLLYESPGGEGFQIADQTLLWVDVDAFEEAMKQANRAERQKHQEDAVSWWERAYAIGKAGSFLPDDVYREWTNARRLSHEMLFPRCVRRLAECYINEERYGEAEEVLRPYWTTHLTDEDMLALLMQTLQVQGLEKEALQCYEQSVRALDEELGVKPHASTTALADRIQEQQRKHKLISPTFVSPVVIEEEAQIETNIPAKETGKVYLLNQQDTASSSFSRATIQDIVEKVRGLERQTNLNTSRRDLLQQLLALVGTVAFSPTFIADHNEWDNLSYDHAQLLNVTEAAPETLESFRSLIDTCRHLSEGNELKVAERILWSYLPHITSLAKITLSDQRTSANIASQGYLLAASLAGHRNDLQARQQLSEQSLLYGKLAADRNLQIAAIRQLAITYNYLGRPDKILQIYQQTFPYLGEVSSLLRACLYADISGAYAQLNQQQEAFRFLELAYEYFPEKYDNEPSFLRTICRYSTLIICDGLHHLHFGQPNEAAKIFARIDGLQPKVAMPERIRIDLLNCQAEVFVELKDMEQATHYLETAGKASITIGSKRRFQESFIVFQQMQKTWKDEPLIRNLESLFI